MSRKGYVRLLLRVYIMFLPHGIDLDWVLKFSIEQWYCFTIESRVRTVAQAGRYSACSSRPLPHLWPLIGYLYSSWHSINKLCSRLQAACCRYWLPITVWHISYHVYIRLPLSLTLSIHHAVYHSVATCLSSAWEVQPLLPSLLFSVGFVFYGSN